jgi:cytochrome bd-type quinol oxidase subunit 2
VPIIPCGILASAFRLVMGCGAAATKDLLCMRWKLLIMTSVAAALGGCGLWCGLAIFVFGSTASLARRDWVLLVSLSIPLVITAIAAFFVYRHTARKRRTQAAITVIGTLMLTVLTYCVAWALFPNYLYIPKNADVRHAR